MDITGVILFNESNGLYYQTTGIIKEDGEVYMRNGDRPPVNAIVWEGQGKIFEILEDGKRPVEVDELPRERLLKGEIIDKYRVFKKDGTLNK